MSFLLEIGQEVTLDSGSSCKIKKYLGGGGQGEVYEVESDNKPYALKWYFENQATPEQLTSIKNLVNKGKPSSSFLWPIDVARNDNSQGFGYIMDLRTAEYKSLFDLMKRRVHPSFLTLSKATYNLVDSFQKLHAIGLCYRDISHGNIFFNDITGDILICDNDNVNINNSNSHGVVGTPRFMAPEIVRAESSPNSDSDLFSLATLIFYMLFVSHPLEGELEAAIKCFDQPAMNRLYGENPVFIFDPNNNTNRPVPGYHRNALLYWNIYPDFLKDIFIRAFTEGMNPNKRVRGGEWKKVLIQLQDSIFSCECGAEIFANKDSNTVDCWHCKRANTDTRLEFENNRGFVTLHSDTKLYDHHISDDGQFDFDTVKGSIATHPQDPSIRGLKNLGSSTWRAIAQNGDIRAIEPGKSIVIKSGTKINFSKIEATII